MKLLVFDFDGVIVDSKNLWVSAVYRALKKRGYKFSERYISERLKAKLKISLRKLKVKVTKVIIDDVHNDITKHIKTIHLCKDIGHVKGIQEHAKTVILTNSPRYFIMKALGDKKRYFDLILCSEDFSTKGNAIIMLMKKFNAKKNETFYVADKVQDVQIARKVGCRIVIVLACSWDKRIWKKKKDRFIIKDLSKLKNAVQ